MFSPCASLGGPEDLATELPLFQSPHLQGCSICPTAVTFDSCGLTATSDVYCNNDVTWSVDMAVVLTLAWKRYLGELNRRPLRTKALTSAFIAGLSDVIAQNIINGAHRNWSRTLTVALYGLLYSGPSAHYWQKFMEYAFKGKKDLHTVLVKVLFDQTTYGPVCNVLFMAFATLVLEGQTTSATLMKIQRDYPLVQLNGWKVWPLASLVNYKFIPVQFRVLFINVVALMWTTFLLLRAKAGAQQSKKA